MDELRRLSCTQIFHKPLYNLLDVFMLPHTSADENEMANLTIVMNQHLSWDLYCKMDFSSYPVDQQVFCTTLFPIFSFSHKN